MDRFANPAGKGRLMAEETSHYAVVAVDDEGRQLARLLDGYIAPQVARVMALLGVPDQLGETARTAQELASATGAAPGPLARLLADRTEIIAGDFFAEVPAGDLHVLSNVLHDWEDDEARRIVANCHRAGRPGGGLLVVGYLMPSPPEPSLAYLMDLLMMMVMGGRERSLAELRSLMAAEGYKFARDVPLGDSPAWQPWHVVEFLRQ
jgi:SAM-dependent methyltransferase